MFKRTVPAVALVIAGSARVFAQQPPSLVITDRIKTVDAANYLVFGNAFSADESIAQRSYFDPANNTYILADHPHEEHRDAGKEARDPLLDLREFTYNCDAVISH